MDSRPERDGYLLDVIDDRWRADTLPKEDIAVPQSELPELEPENGNTNETLREQDQKWLDLALHQLQESGGVPVPVSTSGSNHQ